MNKLDKQYLQLVQDILDYGVEKKDRTGTGAKSIFGYTIRHKMSDGFPLLTTKKMAWKTMVTELLWFLKGDTNIKYLVDNDCHIWDGDAYKYWFENGRTDFEKFADPMFISDDALGKEKFHQTSMKWFIEQIKTDDEFANKWGELGPIYGKQWRSWKKPNHLTGPCEDEYTTDLGFISKEEYEIEKDFYVIDQIQNLINDLKTNPDSRRLMVSAWNVGELDQMVLPPCHNFWQMYSIEKEGKRYLSIMVNLRSNDIPLGLPFNIASYGLLLEIISRLVDMIPNELIINIGDAHIYLNQLEGIKEQLTREPFDLPKLSISNQVNFDEGIDEFLNSCLITDFQVENYQSHPSIKLPLSN